MNSSVSLKGASGAMYDYTAYQMDGGWNAVPGNYAFAKFTEFGNWQLFYCGETTNLRRAMLDSGLWADARSLGCTHILAHASDDGEQARKTEMRDIVEAEWPPLNRRGH